MSDNKVTDTAILTSNAHWGTRALVNLMHRERLPNSYVEDLAMDIDLLYREQPACFIVVLRENGCDVGLPNLQWSQERVAHLGKEGGARVFTVELKGEKNERDFMIERRGIGAAMEWLRRQETQVRQFAPMNVEASL
jgi:hypothetical protein